MMSAYFPASIVPTSFERPMRSAEFCVAVRIACAGVIPNCTMVTNCLALSPCGYTPASVSERHLHPSLHRFLKRLALDAADHLLFVDIFLRQAKLDGLAEQVVVVVDIHDKVGAVLLGKLNVFIAGQAGMLDGIDARQD